MKKIAIVGNGVLGATVSLELAMSGFVCEVTDGKADFDAGESIKIQLLRECTEHKKKMTPHYRDLEYKGKKKGRL